MSTTAAEPREWLTVSDLADLLGTSDRTIRSWIAAGRGPRSHKLEGLRRFRRADVEQWIDAQADDSNA